MVTESKSIDLSEACLLPPGIDDGDGGSVICRRVEPMEFYQLAVSSRLLVRCDDGAAGLRGLWDPTERVWYIIDEDCLYTSLSRTGQLEPVGA